MEFSHLEFVSVSIHYVLNLLKCASFAFNPRPQDKRKKAVSQPTITSQKKRPGQLEENIAQLGKIQRSSLDHNFFEYL